MYVILYMYVCMLCMYVHHKLSAQLLGKLSFETFWGRASIEACDVSPGTSIDGVQSLTSLLCLLYDTYKYELEQC